MRGISRAMMEIIAEVPEKGSAGKELAKLQIDLQKFEVSFQKIAKTL
jgi:hypothetical protein